ncbi:MAG: NAD(P)/FAD-dependent oxidoreductase [Candidatus Micrarchaeota archaeon]|nr:NAD(P)/FAD-dependent oxidoreductase [Candidatus Micrarchaeota archaeon]
MREIRILGAGVSGLTSAINLSKSGYKTTVFDRAGDSGTRFGGDLQGLENWSSDTNVVDELKQSGVKINFDCDPFRKVILTDGKEEARVTFKSPIFYLVKRGAFDGTLDNALKQQALDAGADLRYKEKPAAPIDIFATGPESKRVLGVDKGIVFETDMEDTAVALADIDAGYMGYSYLLVTKGYGCVCSAITKDLGMINKCFTSTLKIFEKMYGLEVRRPRKVGGVATFNYRGKLVDNGKLYVGEAAGLQDFLWGFGIRSAIVSGYLASESISKGLDYKKLIEKRYRGYIRSAVVNRFLWEKFGKRGYGEMIKKVKSVEDPDRLFHKLYSYTTAHKIVFPFARMMLKPHYPRAGF